MNILNKIDKLRKERGWSVNYLAMEAELTQSTLNNLYARNTEPKLSTLRSLCGAFGITLAEFFADENDTVNESESELLQLYRRLDENKKKALLTVLRSMK